MSHTPSVSVAICTFNRLAYLREAVDSVQSQTYRDFELIICDDASTDGTPTLCSELEASDARVRILRHPVNLGMIGNWNSGLLAARGRYYAKLDDDNRYLPTFLEKTVGMLVQNPEADFAFTDEWFIDTDGARLRQVTEENSRRYGRTGLTAGLHRDTPLLAVSQSCGINSTTFVRQTLLDAGGFREIGGTIADLDVFLNMAARGSRACHIPERLGEYRTHEEMGTHDLVTNTQKARQAVAMWESCRFEGQAERVRRRKLAIAYRSLGRTHLLGGDVEASSRALKSALRVDPTHLVPLLLLSFLRLPAPLVRATLRKRYGWGWAGQSTAQAPSPAAGKPGLP